MTVDEMFSVYFQEQVDFPTSQEILDRLAADARKAFGADVVVPGRSTVSIDFGEAVVTLIVRDNMPYFTWIRSRVTSLEAFKDVGDFCEEALRANLFWRETGGAILSIDEEGANLFLSEPIHSDMLASPEALADFVRTFLDTLVDWRLRARSHLGGVAALPDSARFSPEPEKEPDEPTIPESEMEIFR